MAATAAADPRPVAAFAGSKLSILRLPLFALSLDSFECCSSVNALTIFSNSARLSLSTVTALVGMLWSLSSDISRGFLCTWNL